MDTHLIPRESVKGDDGHCVYNMLLQEQKILLVQRQITQGVQTEIIRNVKQQPTAAWRSHVAVFQRKMT